MPNRERRIQLDTRRVADDLVTIMRHLMIKGQRRAELDAAEWAVKRAAMYCQATPDIRAEIDKLLGM